MLKTIVTGLLSFIAGITCYILTLRIVWGESLGGDADAVLLWGGFAFFLIAVPIYLVIIKFINTLSLKHTYFFYPISCIMIFFIPTSFILFSFGGVSVSAMFSPEAMLFHSFFIASGFIFGIVSYMFRKREVKIPNS